MQPSPQLDKEVVGLEAEVASTGEKILKGVDLVIGEGEVHAIMGLNGSGKSTLIRAVVGVQRVRSGEVTVLGVPAGSPGLRTRVGYVTQAPSVYADLTVRENARYFAALYGRGAREADAAVADVGLADAAHQRVHRSLSGYRDDPNHHR